MKKCFAIFILFFFSLSQDINNTNYKSSGARLAFLLLNQLSSNFPRAAFLDRVLYGHTDVPFLVPDIYNNMGNFINGALQESDIIIDSGKSYGAVAYNSSHFILPVKNDLVKIVNASSIKDYFPAGYIIKRPSFSMAKSQNINIFNAKINSSTFCKACEGYITHNKDYSKYEDNTFIYLMIESRDSLITMFFGGYLESYNPNTGEGKYRLVVYEFESPGNEPQFSLANGPSNCIAIIDNDNSMMFKINSTFLIDGYNSEVFIHGEWKYNSVLFKRQVMK